MMAPETLFGFGCANYPATNWATVKINLVAIFGEDAITHTPLKCRVTLLESRHYRLISLRKLCKIGLCFEVGRRVPCLYLKKDPVGDLSLKFCKQMMIMLPHIVG